MIDEKLLIFGAGSHARKLADSLRRRGDNVLGFVTTHQSALKELEGLPVFTWETVPHYLRGQCPIACGIFNRSDAYDQLAKTIRANGFSRILWPWDYYPYLHHDLGWCYWLDPNPRPPSAWRQDSDYQEIVSNLADSESRKTLDRILAFRSGSDLEFASYTSHETQYFNPLTLGALNPGKPVSFLDVGAYNGDTLESLIQYAEVTKAVLIEPDPDNLNLLSLNLDRLTRLHQGLNPYVLPVGAGAEHCSLSLSGEGEATTVSINGDTDSRTTRFATITPIDSIMPAECFDFIKVDVEGHDLQALRGMRELLHRSHAVLAISLYHRPLDVVHLPLAVIDLLDGIPYEYFIRQHMHNSFDTVFYAIPGRVKR
ncbi:FkbM family methyltransferase [Synechococcus sp. HK05]|uniref:FkbM family methyltransferase n=1 Tax=Synechococcus sp. HK05 TaxID=2725975 RepID=UPI001C385BC6|nr:FkbM family methyltransferase [Synechococcus sp. HK05]MBV2352092.1 FkbM family methyltransferase [Synechococcus sp. HK05]